MSWFSWQALPRAFHGAKSAGRMDVQRPDLPPEEHFFIYLLLDIGLDIRDLLLREGNEQDYRESQELLETLSSPLLKGWAEETNRSDIYLKMIAALKEIQKSWAVKVS